MYFWYFNMTIEINISVSLFLNFYCYSITVVCLFSPSLYPTSAEPLSLPHLHPPPWDYRNYYKGHTVQFYEGRQLLCSALGLGICTRLPEGRTGQGQGGLLPPHLHLGRIDIWTQSSGFSFLCFLICILESQMLENSWSSKTNTNKFC